MKKFIALTALLCCLSVSLLAQSSELTGVRKNEFRGVFPILNKETKYPEGYYCFYVNEKLGKGDVEFNVAIFDLEMKLIKQTPITITKNANVDGSEFNGSDFLFVFNDFYAKDVTYVTMDKEGNILAKRKVEEAKFMASTADVYPAGDNAFIIVKPIKEDKWGYSLEKVDRDLKTIWKVNKTVEKGFVSVENIDVENGRLVMIETGATSRIGGKVTGNTVVYDDATGKELWRYPLYDGTNTAMPTILHVDEAKNVTLSGMYFDGERWNGQESDGIFFLMLGADGKKKSYVTENWKANIQPLIKNASKAGLVISSRPKVLFHNIVEQPDGSYQVIGETFKENMQLVSSSMVDALSGRYIGNMNTGTTDKPVTFEIMDFIVFYYSPEGKMTQVSIIEKEHTKISLYSPYNSMGSLAAARYVKAYGFFNYAFVTRLPGDATDVLVSANFVKSPYIGFSKLSGAEEGTTQKILVTRRMVKGGGIGVMPNIGGNIAVYIFDKKEQTVLLYKEPVKF